LTRTRVARTAGALLLTLALSTCSSDSSAGDTTTAADVLPAAVPPASAAPAGVLGIEPISQTRALTCATDRQTLELVLEAYFALNGTPPSDELSLVPDLLREPVQGWDLDAAGNVIPAAGGPCA